MSKELSSDTNSVGVTQHCDYIYQLCVPNFCGLHAKVQFSSVQFNFNKISVNLQHVTYTLQKSSNTKI